MCGVWSMKIAILSGCRYTDCGGAQRPPALARSFIEFGHEVDYHCRMEPRRSVYADRVHIVESDALADADLCICCLPEYAPLADRLRQDGAVVIYDLLDDWDGFVARGDLQPHQLAMEAELVRIASLVTCSAPSLVARAARLGALHTLLVPNAGPDWAFPVLTQKYDWVYSGYLYGSWLNWHVLNLLDETGLSGLLIGRYDNLPDWKNTEARGELSHSDALSAMSSAKVGVIPFQGELCRSVDPIKYYDYLAAGLWTVTTPDVEPLAGRPYVRMASPERFVEAVIESINDYDRYISPSVMDLQGERWRDRAGTILEAARTLRPTDEPPIPVPAKKPKREHWNGIRLANEDCRLRVTWMAPASCNMEPPCPYCSNIDTRIHQPPLGADPQALLDGFRWLSEIAGPLYLSVCYGEPMSNQSTIEIAAELAKYNRVDIVSNLIAPLDVWEQLACRPNVAVAASYHPHHWTVTEFLRHRRRIGALGIRMGIVNVVAYPPDDTEQSDSIVQDIRNRGIEVWRLPYGGPYHGVTYPLPSADASDTAFDLSKIRCRTGMDYIAVDTAGTAYRCYTMGEPIGSILDKSVQLATDAHPCTQQVCSCDDMHQFWVV